MPRASVSYSWSLGHGPPTAQRPSTCDIYREPFVHFHRANSYMESSRCCPDARHSLLRILRYYVRHLIKISKTQPPNCKFWKVDLLTGQRLSVIMYCWFSGSNRRNDKTFTTMERYRFLNGLANLLWSNNNLVDIATLSVVSNVIFR
jgi:hypothetical protein